MNTQIAISSLMYSVSFYEIIKRETPFLSVLFTPITFHLRDTYYSLNEIETLSPFYSLLYIKYNNIERRIKTWI